MARPRSPGGIFHSATLLLLCTLSAPAISQSINDVEFWNIERPKDMSNLASLEVMCGKTHMEVQVSFDRPFNGIIFSKGAVDQYNCIYVKPQTGSIAYSFNILYDQCGTKPDMNGKFYENNIVIQYDKDLIEVWDEAKRLRCEWYNDYEKGITKPPIRVSDLEVVELNFRGDNVDCWMEIQHGKGPWASPVSGIVPLGTTLTMVVGINDKQGEFDMRVKSCSAEAENSRPIQLSDEHGCVLRPKMISKFMKIAGADTRATVVTYAFFHAFKFPDSMSVHVKCKVEICRFGCPDHCQKPSGYAAREQEVSSSINVPQYRPGPRFEAHKAAQNRLDRPADNEVGESSSSVRRIEALPRPLGLVQAPPPQPVQVVTPAAPARAAGGPVAQSLVQDRENAQLLNIKEQVLPEQQRAAQNLQLSEGQKVPAQSSAQSAPSLSKNSGPRYIPRPPNSPPPTSSATGKSAAANVPETDKKSPVSEFLEGLRLPKLPTFSNIFGSDSAAGLRLTGDEQAENNRPRRVESEAIPVQLGVRPLPGALRTATVPVHRTDKKDQPLVYPSSFLSDGEAPVERPNNGGQLPADGSGFPYGPRGLHFDKRSVGSGRNRRSAPAGSSEELGVTSGYQVISEVDLAFKPSFESGMGVAVFQGRMLPEEVVYGICLPATGFSALFVLVSLLTIISVLVSGFVCYHRQIQKQVEEGAPAPVAPTPVRPWGVSTLLRMPKV